MQKGCIIVKRVADIVIETIDELNIRVCFSVVGGGAMHLNNAFVLNDKIKKIYNHHEQACTMAAEAYAKSSGQIAVVCVTSGPGGTNAINGVQGAWVENIPMIVISGYPRIETSMLNTDLNIRYRGVQENDIISQVKNITKYSKLVTDAYKVKNEIKKAVNIALEGRRGPVWIDIPLDIQGKYIDENKMYVIPTEKNDVPYNNIEEDVEQIVRELENAKRPCMLTGSGIRNGDAIEGFRKFIEKVKIPIVGGCLQADICYNGQKMYYGMSGTTGPRAGNFILQNADYILVLGNSLPFRQTGFNQKKFACNARIVMIDAERDEAKKEGLHIDKCIACDLKEFFKYFCINNQNIYCDDIWIEYCNNVKRRFKPFEVLEKNIDLSFDELVPALYWWKKILPLSDSDAVFALGNSSCVGGILQEGINTKYQRVIANRNCGSMGYDLPSSIGTAVALNKTVICVTGDGSIMMNIQELQTIVYNKLPVKIVVFSNNGYGAIRNTCSNFFNGVYTGCDSGSGVSFPNFEKIAYAFEMPYCCCHNIGEIEETWDWLQKQQNYCILEVKEPINEVQGLKLMSKMRSDGNFDTPALQELYPFISETEMKKWMLVSE